MSDNQEQEMEFADPAWQPRVTQEFEPESDSSVSQPAWAPPPRSGSSTQTASTTQEYDQERDYAQGYRAEPPPEPGFDGSLPGQQQQAYYPPPQQSRFSGIPGWVWILIIIACLGGVGPVFSIGSGGHFIGAIFTVFIIFVLWLLLSRRMRVNLTGEKQQPETRTFVVGAQPTISVNNKAGSIRMYAGQEGQITINTSRRGYVFLNRGSINSNDPQIVFNQDDAKNTVFARVSQWKLFGNGSVDFDIMVPPQANVNVSTNAGNISVQGVTGQMVLRSDAGSINASQTTLEGRSRCKTDAGSITFSGELDPQGDYSLTTDLGGVNVTLPAYASFHLHASTDLGSVTTNFPFTPDQTKKIKQDIGSGAHPRLRLKTDIGSITVNHQ